MIALICCALSPCVNELCVQPQTEHSDLTDASALLTGKWVLDMIPYYFQLVP